MLLGVVQHPATEPTLSSWVALPSIGVAVTGVFRHTASSIGISQKKSQKPKMPPIFLESEKLKVPPTFCATRLVDRCDI